MRPTREAGDLPVSSLWNRIQDVALLDVAITATGGSAGSLESLEELLLQSDIGVPTTLKLVADVERLAKLGRTRTEAEFLGALKRRHRRVAGDGAGRL